MLDCQLSIPLVSLKATGIKWLNHSFKETLNVITKEHSILPNVKMTQEGHRRSAMCVMQALVGSGGSH